MRNITLTVSKDGKSDYKQIANAITAALEYEGDYITFRFLTLEYKI